jgi:hypothetical protein
MSASNGMGNPEAPQSEPTTIQKSMVFMSAVSSVVSIRYAQQESQDYATT